MKILHLCYDLMNLYGDYANVSAINRILSEKGEEVIKDSLSVGDEIDFSQYSFIYIGSGTERNQKVALEFLKPYTEQIEKALENNTVILATGNSLEIFGKEITDCDGKIFKGLGLFDYTTVETKLRTVTDEVCTCKLCEGRLVGFVNKCSEIFGVEQPLFDVEQGSGNNSQEKTEGVIHKNFFATHLIGPLLIKNPAFAQCMAEKILKG